MLRTVCNHRYGRFGAVVLATSIYAIVFLGLRDKLGGATAALVVLPVMLVAALYGLRAGIIAALLALPLNTLLYHLSGEGGLDVVHRIGGSPGQLAVLLVGAVVGWTRDVRVASQKLLLKTQRLHYELDAMLNIIPDGLLRLDATGQILDYRPGQEAALQFDKHIIGQHYAQSLPRELVQLIRDHHADAPSTKTMNLPNQCGYEVQMLPLFEEQLIVLLRDLTGQKRSEQQRLELSAQQNRIAYLQEFIGNLSHDLKTPLSVIKTNLYLLQRLNDPQKQADKLEQIKLQTQHLEKLIEDILMLTRLDSTLEQSLIFMNLRGLVQSVVSTYQVKAAEKSLVLLAVIPENTPMILANQESLQRVLSNVLDNAVTYTEHGQITVRVYVAAGSVHIEISDTGIGMTTEESARIFERFYRADKARSIHTGGAGLGLSIARRIIEIHQGELRLESTPGVGTTFTIGLPLFKARAQEFVANVPTEPSRPDDRQAEAS